MNILVSMRIRILIASFVFFVVIYTHGHRYFPVFMFFSINKPISSLGDSRFTAQDGFYGVETVLQDNIPFLFTSLIFSSCK